jgi:hypothetical protein
MALFCYTVHAVERRTREKTGPMARAIQLSKGQGDAIVSDADYDAAACWPWRLDRAGYVSGKVKEGGKWRTVYLHRWLMGEPEKMVVDHINGNRLDNRRENLRIVTYAQNNRNSDRRGCNSHSQYKGVYFQAGRWRAQIGYEGRAHHLGTFYTEEAAARAYDAAAIAAYGEFARLNFPDSPSVAPTVDTAPRAQFGLWDDAA